MDVRTGELGEYAKLLEAAKDPLDVVPVPDELELLARTHLAKQGRFVDLEGGSPLAQFAHDHLRRKKEAKAKARDRRKKARMAKARLRRRRKR